MRSERKHTLKAYEPQREVRPEEYAPYVGPEMIEGLIRLAQPLRGKRWANVNSTFEGGGVAEMLRSVVPLARGLGIDAQWYLMHGTDDFFNVTKKFHNTLQGIDQPITIEEIFHTYLDTISANGNNTHIAADMIVVHDPQPLGLIAKGVLYGNVLWRCHIDTSKPVKSTWRFLLPYINHSVGTIFTMPEFVGPGLQVPVYEITPCIDPLLSKNHIYTLQEALDVLRPLFSSGNIDPRRPIITAISRYDIHKNQEAILRAFLEMRKRKTLDPAPYMIFLGNTASDDPEGGMMLEHLRALSGDDPDIRFWVNVEDNDRVVGALMNIARAFVHVSTREGFGLVVSEALWQGTPVIGSNIGGITKQVIDGKTGYLVDPNDVDAIATRMARVLEQPGEARSIGAAGCEHVRKHFLTPELVRRYVVLMRYYAGIDLEPPPFRLNDISYREHLSRFQTKYVVEDPD
jgi:trehalose synthase